MKPLTSSLEFVAQTAAKAYSVLNKEGHEDLILYGALGIAGGLIFAIPAFIAASVRGVNAAGIAKVAATMGAVAAIFFATQSDPFASGGKGFAWPAPDPGKSIPFMLFTGVGTLIYACVAKRKPVA